MNPKLKFVIRILTTIGLIYIGLLIVGGFIFGNFQGARSLQWYEFTDKISGNYICSSIDSAYKLHPEWIPPQSEFYKLDGKTYKRNGKYYLYIKIEDSPILLYFKIDCSNNFESHFPNTIILMSGARFGDVLELASNISYWDELKYKRLIEENLIHQIEVIMDTKYKFSLMDLLP